MTVSTVKPVEHHLITEVLMSSEEDTQVTKDIKRGVLVYIREKYISMEVNDLLDAATFKDPKFRERDILTTLIRMELFSVSLKRLQDSKKLSTTIKPH